MALDLRTGSINHEQLRHEIRQEQQRIQFNPLYHKTYEFIRTYSDELGTVKHEFRCVVCGVNPHVPERNMRHWSGHCSCRPPATNPYPAEYRNQSSYGVQTRPRAWSNAR